MERVLQQTRCPDLTVSRRGVLGINARVTRMLRLEAGDVVDITVEGVECYLYVRHRGAETVGRHEATCKPTSRCKRHCRNMRVHSVALCRRLLAMCRQEDHARLMAGDLVYLDSLGGEAVPIVTRKSL
jgi:hypothetical protein